MINFVNTKLPLQFALNQTHSVAQLSTGNIFPISGMTYLNSTKAEVPWPDHDICRQQPLPKIVREDTRIPQS